LHGSLGRTVATGGGERGRGVAVGISERRKLSLGFERWFFVVTYGVGWEGGCLGIGKTRT